jgi:hypothetical protein
MFESSGDEGPRKVSAKDMKENWWLVTDKANIKRR